MTRLNPLNIDYGQIIAKGQERSDLLGQINDLVHTKVDAALNGLTDAENFFNELNRIWRLLDAEGRAMLPEHVRIVASMASQCQGSISTVIGSKQKDYVGLVSIAEYGLQYKAQSDEATERILSHFPMAFDPKPKAEPVKLLTPADIHPAQGTLKVVFEPDWAEYPDGIWVAGLDSQRCDTECIFLGIGRNPNDAYSNWAARNR